MSIDKTNNISLPSPLLNGEDEGRVGSRSGVDFNNLDAILDFTGIGGRQAEKPRMKKGDGERAPRANAETRERSDNVGKFFGKVFGSIKAGVSAAFTGLSKLFQPKDGADKPAFRINRGLERTPADAPLQHSDKAGPEVAARALGNLATHLEKTTAPATFLRSAGKADNAGSAFLRSHARYDVAVTDALFSADAPLAELTRSIRKTPTPEGRPQLGDLTDAQSALLFQAADRLLDSFLPEPGTGQRALVDVFTPEARAFTAEALETIGDESLTPHLSDEDRKSMAHSFVSSETFLKGVMPTLMMLGRNTEALEQDEAFTVKTFASGIVQSVFSGASELNGAQEGSVQSTLYRDLAATYRPRVEEYCVALGLPDHLRKDS